MTDAVAYKLMQDYNAKLSDFGLARDGPTGDNTHVSTRVVGTQGYAAPEYVATGVFIIFPSNSTVKTEYDNEQRKLLLRFGCMLVRVYVWHGYIKKNFSFPRIWRIFGELYPQTHV